MDNKKQAIETWQKAEAQYAKKGWSEDEVREARKAWAKKHKLPESSLLGKGLVRNIGEKLEGRKTKLEKLAGELEGKEF